MAVVFTKTTAITKVKYLLEVTQCIYEYFGIDAKFPPGLTA